MLAIIRVILVIFSSTIICVFGLIYCLFSPRNPHHAAIFGRWFGRMSLLFGIKLELRNPQNKKIPQNCIYISNHQNNYDMVTVAYAIQQRTITVGKKSLLWIPLFGLLYWLSGNLLINRNYGTSAYSTLIKIVQSIKKRNISIWVFPEGTRSRGRGLLPFKTGVFYAAITANVPIVPICVSNISNKIRLNRWSNGLVIIEIMSPIETCDYNRKQVRIFTKYCRNIMKNKIDELNNEVTKLESIKN